MSSYLEGVGGLEKGLWDDRQVGAKPVSEPLTPSLIPLGCPLRTGLGGPGPAGFSRALPPPTRGRPGDASVGPALEVRPSRCRCSPSPNSKPVLQVTFTNVYIPSVSEVPRRCGD